MEQVYRLIELHSFVFFKQDKSHLQIKTDAPSILATGAGNADPLQEYTILGNKCFDVLLSQVNDPLVLR